MTESQKWRQGADRAQWFAELERRMARADSPIPMTDAEKLDVREALILWNMAKLPDRHPLRLTKADVELLRMAADLFDARFAPAPGELDPRPQWAALAERLARLVPPFG